MSLVQTFVDAFKKAAGKKPDAKEHARNDGLLGSTDNFRETPQPGTSKGIDRGGVTPGSVSVGSADPEEGGEIDSGDVSPGSIAVSSGDPEEGGEFQPPAK